MKIVILESAEQDLNDLRSYIIKSFSSRIWRATYAKLKKSIRELQDFPLSGGVPEELQTLHPRPYRQLVSGQNRIIYEIRQDTIYIHAIVDVRRNIKALLMRRLLRSA